MFDFLKKKESAGIAITFEITGMHCSSCAMNIDDALEDTAGVLKSDTSYAKGTTTIEYNPELITVSQIQSVIQALDYHSKIR